MKRLAYRILIMGVAALMALALTAPAFAQGNEAQVRVAHLASDAPNVDVYVNGEIVPALTNVPFGTVSAYLPLPAGTQQITVYATGDTSTPVIDTPVEIVGGAAYTIAAVGLVSDGSLTAQVYEDDNTAPAAGNAHVRIVHASPDAGPVDVATADLSTYLVEGLEFPGASDYAPVPAGTYDLSVLAAGTDTAAISAPGTSVADGGVYTAFAVGTAAAGDLGIVLTQDSSGGMTAMPDTGGFISPMTAVSVAAAAAAMLVFGTTGYVAVRRRNS